MRGYLNSFFPVNDHHYISNGLHSVVMPGPQWLSSISSLKVTQPEKRTTLLRKRSCVLKILSYLTSWDGLTSLHIHKLIITAHKWRLIYESKKSSTDELHPIILPCGEHVVMLFLSVFALSHYKLQQFNQNKLHSSFMQCEWGEKTNVEESANGMADMFTCHRTTHTSNISLSAASHATIKNYY